MERTERMLADIERGFEALEEGRIDDAESALERARRVDRKSADVIQLAAAVADANGDAEDAMEQYQALKALRPDDPMPRICIARLELRDFGDPDAALDTLDEAFEFIDEEEDLIEGIFLKCEALIAREDLPAAREALAELASSAIEDAELALDAAELAISAEDAPTAIKWLDVAKKADPECLADATHALGRVYELTGEREKMIAAWQEVRKLDLAGPKPELSVSDDEIEKITVGTLEELPENIRTLLAKVPILVDDVPSEDIVADGFDPRSLGFFQGTPMPEEGNAQPSVTTILLFKTNLERYAQDTEHLAEEIRITVLHETAHYFGLDDDDLEEIGLG